MGRQSSQMWEMEGAAHMCRVVEKLKASMVKRKILQWPLKSWGA